MEMLNKNQMQFESRLIPTTCNFYISFSSGSVIIVNASREIIRPWDLGESMPFSSFNEFSFINT